MPKDKIEFPDGTTIEETETALLGKLAGLLILLRCGMKVAEPLVQIGLKDTYKTIGEHLIEEEGKNE